MSRAGRYELLRPLARGGMAEVFLARRRAAGVEKLLVVKRIRPERAGDARFLDLFVREARLSMSLAHQNIVPVFDFGRAGDQVFLAMERVEGKDLGSSLARPGAGPLPPLLAAFVGAECCQALDYAHQRRGADGVLLGIVHRDVTPRNVLLSWSGEVKLTDFGIAALAGESTTKLIGTPAYMAPEQARGEPLDARADVYAVGLVIREALTGARARPGDDRDALVAAARRGELAPWPDAPQPAELVEIIDRATAADRDARFPDTRALLAALDAFIVGERATNRGDAPARQLAAWLAAAWVGDREDPPLDPAELLELSPDDLGAMGTGTEHSMAATAADDHDPIVAPTTVTVTPPPPTVAPPPPTTRRRSTLLVAIGGAAAIAAVVAWRTSDSEPAQLPPPAPPVGLTPPTGPRPPEVPTPPVGSGSASAPVRPPLGSGSGQAVAIVPSGSAVPRPRNVPRLGSGSGSGSGSAPGSGSEPGSGSATPLVTTAKTRRATINATPWAYFTIDDDPTQHTTVETLDLAVGEHRIHFWNPALHAERYATVTVEADRDLRFVIALDR